MGFGIWFCHVLLVTEGLVASMRGYRTTQHVIRCINVTNRGRNVAVPHELH